MAVTKPLNTVLIKPAGPDCNMACTYCFYYDKTDLFKKDLGETDDNDHHLMDEETLEETLKQTLHHASDKVNIAWQGGEPTLRGFSFFKKVVDIQLKYGKGLEIANAFQTNGFLLNRKWARFFHKYNFLIGLSLDGPEHIHNRYRLINGAGSWQKVVDNLEILLEHDVQVNAMTVVNDYSVKFPAEIYEFHKNRGLVYMQFIPCVETDPDDPGFVAPFSVPPLAYGEFLCKLFDLWVADFHNGYPTTSVRFFESVVFSYLNLIPPECTFSEECGMYVVVEHNGDVYSCDYFVEQQNKLGNIHNGNIYAMLNSAKQHEFGDSKKKVPAECLKCRWFQHCRGGCLKDRIRDPQSKGKNYFCESMRIFFAYADSRLNSIAANYAKVML